MAKIWLILVILYLSKPLLISPLFINCYVYLYYTNCTIFGTTNIMNMSIKKTVEVVFYKHANGGEPVKEWLYSLSRADRKNIGADIKTAEFG